MNYYDQCYFHIQHGCCEPQEPRYDRPSWPVYEIPAAIEAPLNWNEYKKILAQNWSGADIKDRTSLIAQSRSPHILPVKMFPPPGVSGQLTYSYLDRFFGDSNRLVGMKPAPRGISQNVVSFDSALQPLAPALGPVYRVSARSGLGYVESFGGYQIYSNIQGPDLNIPAALLPTRDGVGYFGSLVKPARALGASFQPAAAHFVPGITISSRGAALTDYLR